MGGTTHAKTLRLGLGAGGALVVLAFSGQALADEPRKVTEPRVLQEPAEITSVVDAFDDSDPFDLHITLGFQQVWKSAKIRRETFIRQPELASGGYTSQQLNVAEYKETTSRLNTRMDIGLYKDIALFFRLPVILANDRELKGLDNSDNVQDTVLQGAPGEQVFRLPFKSPTRSGIEYFAAGIDFGIMNQFRNTAKPTWILGFEGRFSVSEPMHACSESTEGLNQLGPQRKCAFPSDINRDGTAGFQATQPDGNDPIELEGNFSGDREPGVSRGTTALEVHTYLSKRIKYIEPYGGFHALFEFQNDSSDYGSTDLKGSLVNHPPLRGGFVLGLQVTPWEVRDQYQRFAIDFRFNGEYVSEGRDYSELFDALGSSDARTLRYPNFASFQAAPPGTPANFPSVVNPGSQKVYFTGLTDVQQHGRYRLGVGLLFQAGEYIKFTGGAGYTLVQGHFIAFDQPCNPDFSSTDNARSGPCRSSTSTGTSGARNVTGIPNPNYRHAINVPGRRFRVADSNAIDAYLNATVMF